MITDADVARCLLGTWPSQTAVWGEDGIAAYISELAARGVTPDAALLALRAYDPDADFPPSAAKLAALTRKDPKALAGLEVVDVLWGAGGVMHARSRDVVFVGPDGRRKADDQARLDAAVDRGPRIVAFFDAVGVDALKNHDPSDSEWGEANRRWLVGEWGSFNVRADERGVAKMIADRHGDPLGALRRAQAADRLALEDGAA